MMSSIRQFLLVSCLCLLALPLGLAGTITTGKSGSAQALVIKYSPDLDGSLASNELLITVSTSAGVASLAERNLEVVLYVCDNSAKTVAYSVPVTLTQGAVTASAKLHFVQPVEGYASWVVDVFEDGRRVTRPASNPSSINNPTRKTWLEITPAPNVATSFQMDYGLTGIQANAIGLSSASEDWRTYLAYDAVAISPLQLANASPLQVQALSTFVTAGGTLVVHSANSQSTLELDRLLSSDSNLPSPDFRWKSIEMAGPVKVGSKRSHGGGLLLVFEVTSNVNEQVRSAVQFPTSDFAIKGHADFKWFWSNLVQSVGTAPIWGFIAFISLFVFIVGPVVLRLTTRMRHRTLLLFLVPALSLMATLLVLVYNVVREGFGTYGRIASIQFIDEHTGQGFTWSRQSYFSGAPSREVRLPQGAFLRPIEGDSHNYNLYVNEPRDQPTMVIRSDEDSLTITGWLLPRSQQQLLVGQRSNNAKLPFEVARISDNLLRVTNISNHVIPLLFLKQTGEVAYFFQDLQPGQMQEVASQSADMIDKQYRKLLQAAEPQSPDSIDGSNMGYYRYSNRISTNDALDNVMKRFACGKLDDFGFLLLMDQPPDIPLPFEKSVYVNEKHFHIMTGVTKW